MANQIEPSERASAASLAERFYRLDRRLGLKKPQPPYDMPAPWWVRYSAMLAILGSVLAGEAAANFHIDLDVSLPLSAALLAVEIGFLWRLRRWTKAHRVDPG